MLFIANTKIKSFSKHLISNIMNIMNIICNLLCRHTQHSPPANSGIDFEKSIENLLGQLCCYGHPRLTKLETGWWCYMKENDVGIGVTLNIGSEIRHTHPADAIAECLQRVQASGLPKLTDTNPFRSNR
jgi:hypothetical protein